MPPNSRFVPFWVRTHGLGPRPNPRVRTVRTQGLDPNTQFGSELAVLTVRTQGLDPNSQFGSELGVRTCPNLRFVSEPKVWTVRTQCFGLELPVLIRTRGFGRSELKVRIRTRGFGCQNSRLGSKLKVWILTRELGQPSQHALHMGCFWLSQSEGRIPLL